MDSQQLNARGSSSLWNIYQIDLLGFYHYDEDEF